MGDLREETEHFVSKRPERVTALHEILAIDGRNRRWDQRDIRVASEDIDELVSRGIVLRTDDGFIVADRGTVQEVLDESDSEGGMRKSSLMDSARNRGLPFLLSALVVALAFVALVRVTFVWDLVFRNGHVVLLENDPYLYRYWVEALTNRFGGFSVGSLAHLPGQIETHDVLTVVAMWAATSIFGDDPRTIGTVLAWLPVVEALVAAFFVYLYTVYLTDDDRAGIVAVVLLAVTPIFAARTALGFADHHAFDAVFLATTATSVVVLAKRSVDEGPTKRNRPWAATVGLGIGVAGQVLSWRGGPLFLVPILCYALIKAGFDARNGRSAFFENRFLVWGLGLGAALALLPHVAFGWVQLYRALAPLLLLCITVALFVLVNIFDRWGVIKTTACLGILLLVAVVASQIAFFGSIERTVVGLSHGGMAWQVFGDPVNTLFVYLRRTGRSNITEAVSLVGSGVNSFLIPMRAFGFVLFLSVPYLIWASWLTARERRAKWLVAIVYAWYFLGLSLVQIRFAGQLALFVVPFAGVGIVHIATTGWRRRPVGFVASFDARGTFSTMPGRRTVIVVLLLFLLIVPSGVFISSLQMRGLGIHDDTYRTGMWISQYSDRQGNAYPDNYVFSGWGVNRFYNYFVSGHSKEYRLAQKNYATFLRSDAPDAWAKQFDQWNRPGYIVIRRRAGPFSDTSTYTRLYKHFGSRSGGVPGVKHFRGVHTTDDGAIKVFEVVPGARITTSGAPNTTVRVRTTVRIDGKRVRFERVGRTNAYGDYGVTVPYSGRYRVNGETRSIGETAVRNGRVSGMYRTHFPMDTGHGTRFTDPVGGVRGTVNGASWVPGVRGSALSFEDGTDFARVTGRPLDVRNRSFSVSFWVKGDLDTSNGSAAHVLNAYDSDGGSRYMFYAQHGRLCAHVRDDSGNGVSNCGIGTATFGDWTHIVGVFDRTNGELRLYRNGSLVATQDTSSIGSVSGTKELVISSPSARSSAPMAVDDVRIYGRALTQHEIKRRQRTFLER